MDFLENKSLFNYKVFPFCKKKQSSSAQDQLV